MARRTATRDEERRPQIAGEPVDEVMTPHAATDDQGDQAAGVQAAPPASGAEAPARESPPRARRRRVRSGGRRRGAAADGAGSLADTQAETSARRPGRRGSVAAETHAAVEELLRAQGLTKAQAFERLGAESGRRPGTVAAAYYRAARGGAAATGRIVGRRRAGGGRRADTGATGALEAARDALEQLVVLVRRQEQELARLRAESERYGEIRAILDAGSAPARRGRRRSGAA